MITHTINIKNKRTLPIFIIAISLFCVIATLNLYIGIRNLTTAKRTLGSELTALRAENEKGAGLLKDANRRIAALDADVRRSEERIADLTADLAGAKAELSKASAAIADKEAAISALEGEIAHQNEINKKTEHAVSMAEERYDKLKGMLADALHAKKIATVKLKDIMDELEKEEMTASLGTVVIKK